MLTISLSLSELGLGTTPRGLTTVGITPDGRAETAPASNISVTACVTKTWLSKEDLEFLISLAIGGRICPKPDYNHDLSNS